MKYLFFNKQCHCSCEIFCPFMLALFKRHAFSKFHCVDEKRSSGNEIQTINGCMVLIKLIDQLIVSKWLISK